MNTDTSQKNVMIIDDDDAQQLLYGAWLSEGDAYSCVVADSMQQAKEVLETSVPDVILLDFLMPDEDGFAGLTFLQELFPDKVPPIIFLTGYGNDCVAEDALAMGAVKYVSKDNLTVESLREAVSEVVN